MSFGNEDSDARIRRWLSTGDLSALWPQCSAQEVSAAHQEICRVTRALLNSSGEKPELETNYPATTAALGIAAFVSGMGPLLGWWAAHGKLRVQPPSGQVLAKHLEQGRKRAALLRSHLKQVLAALEEAGLRAIVLKGLHTGSVYLPEPGTRPGADIDLLVEPGNYPVAAHILERLGFQETRKTVFGRRSEWTRPDSPQTIASMELETERNPWHLDLHTALERWYFRGLTASLGTGAFSATSTFFLDDTPTMGLGQPYLAAFLALHASYELVRMRLIRLVELLWVIEKDTLRGTLKWAELLSLVTEKKLARFVYPAFALCESLRPGSIDPEVLQYTEGQATPRLRRVTRQVERENLAPLVQRSLDDKLMWARGFKELVLNLSEWVWPSDEVERAKLSRLYWKRFRMLLGRRARLRVAA